MKLGAGGFTVPDVIAWADNKGAAAFEGFLSQDRDLDAAIVDGPLANTVDDAWRYNGRRDAELLT